MSQSVVAVLLAADVVAILAVSVWLARWFRRPADAAVEEPAGPDLAALLPQPRPVALATLTVLPTVPFTAPPVPRRATVGVEELRRQYG